ncbi:MAG: hypothetical protein NVSMB6_03980 [Burkholderiaceae bacterium]
MFNLTPLAAGVSDIPDAHLGNRPLYALLGMRRPNVVGLAVDSSADTGVEHVES